MSIKQEVAAPEATGVAKEADDAAAKAHAFLEAQEDSHVQLAESRLRDRGGVGRNITRPNPPGPLPRPPGGDLMRPPPGMLDRPAPGMLERPTSGGVVRPHHRHYHGGRNIDVDNDINVFSMPGLFLGSGRNYNTTYIDPMALSAMLGITVTNGQRLFGQMFGDRQYVETPGGVTFYPGTDGYNPGFAVGGYYYGVGSPRLRDRVQAFGYCGGGTPCDTVPFGPQYYRPYGYR